MKLSKERASMVKAALLRAKTLIADRKRWTKHRERTGSQGNGWAYCSIGAVKQATNSYGDDPLIRTDEALSRETLQFLRDIVGQDIAHWNDSAYTDHPAVVATFDRAISEAERQAQEEVNAA